MNAAKRFGCRITDAKDSLTVHVKPTDIKGAVCRDHQKCAIAKAIKRQRGSTAKWVDVGANVVLIGTGVRTAKRYYLSEPAKKQVRYFDENEGAFAPCSVALKPPPGCSRTRRAGWREARFQDAQEAAQSDAADAVRELEDHQKTRLWMGEVTDRAHPAKNRIRGRAARYKETSCRRSENTASIGLKQSASCWTNSASHRSSNAAAVAKRQRQAGKNVR